ncbi:MAG TPA: MFS transporter [Actinoplanes sp.]|nr:MFS transporter [Actinoplanes sp.]
MAAGTEPSSDRTTFHGWRIVGAFAVTQTVGYGTLYYAFAVLLHPMATDLHTSVTVVTGAFTAAILAWAAAAIPVGRWLDRHGGRGLMTTGALAGALLLLAWSRVQTAGQLYLVFAGLGVAMAMALYEAATAVVVSWFDPARRARAVLAMIVVAGLASTIFLPLTGLLNDRYGWRITLVALAVIYGLVAVPLHALIVRRAPTPGTARSTGRSGVRVGHAVRDGRFWCLAVAFVAHSGAMSVMSVHLVGYLISRGHPATFAATATGLLGALSVSGRLLLTGAGRRIPLHLAVGVIFAVQSVAAVALHAVGQTRPGAIAAVVCLGIGFGVASLATPQLLAGRYGTTAYATIAGTLATPVTLARAAAPLGAAYLYTATSGYTAVLTAVAAATTIAAGSILTRARTPPPPSIDPQPVRESAG